MSRYHPGIPVKRPAVTGQAFDVPKLAPYRVISLAELDQRGVGSDKYTSAGRAGLRADNIIVDDLLELEATCLRRMEVFASGLLTTGTITFLLDGEVMESFSYGSGPPVYTPPAFWDDPVNSNPIQDLKNVRSAIIATTGVAPDLAIMSDAVADVFVSHPVVAEQLNKLHLVIGAVIPQRPEGTAQYLGRLLYQRLSSGATRRNTSAMLTAPTIR